MKLSSINEWSFITNKGQPANWWGGRVGGFIFVHTKEGLPY